MAKQGSKRTHKTMVMAEKKKNKTNHITYNWYPLAQDKTVSWNDSTTEIISYRQKGCYSFSDWLEIKINCMEAAGWEIFPFTQLSLIFSFKLFNKKHHPLMVKYLLKIIAWTILFSWAFQDYFFVNYSFFFFFLSDKCMLSLEKYNSTNGQRSYQRKECHVLAWQLLGHDRKVHFNLELTKYEIFLFMYIHLL